ncbi:Hsp20/alpha crystallin family protein [Hymenobacter sp. ASUV-10]|uniref:Hsp20/alpha crystallin family protein n=1 Tax=Hymenobacter aranciens TaxID=3063996 RepID=A0ABT9BA70_9BACT|nr:Hsp20/alpha crystallin family protein [Hymenobacter sp. ASUV-10]MDO7873448.1 Hsp20/alpha crystallin family protein [Hymenobacter sp. ASUV-10]
MKFISPEFIRNIAPQLDLMNTIGGGVAQPRLRVDQREKGVILRVAMPSVSPDTFRVVLNNQRLTVYGEHRNEPSDSVTAPLFVQTLDMPTNLDLARIDAVQEDDELLVRIPFKRPTQREIDVRPADEE